MQEIRKVGRIPFIQKELALTGRDFIHRLGRIIRFIVGPKRTEIASEAIDSRRAAQITAQLNGELAR